MLEKYEEYEKEANEQWNLEEFGLPAGTRISFQDFPSNLRLVYEVRKDLVVEAYRETRLNNDKSLRESFAADAEWELGIWSITDSPWLQDVCNFENIEKTFKSMIKYANKLSAKKVTKEDAKYLSIGVRPIVKFDVRK